MMIIQICIGSSCFIKGSQELVEMFQAAIEEYALSDYITLSGSFCIGRCNRKGVTVQIDDEVITGVTRESFRELFKEHVLKKLKAEGR